MEESRPALYLTAPEAAAELGISPATLYAYVSRGLIRSEARPGQRAKLYLAEDVRALARRADRPDGEDGAERALSGGAVLESALTLIASGHLYYRGRDVADLVPAFSLETVAGLLWFGERPVTDVFPDAGWTIAPGAPGAPGAPEVPGAPCADALPPLQRAQCLLAAAAALDPKARVLTAEGIARTGARIVRGIAASVAGPGAAPRRPDPPVHDYLADAWRLPPDRADLLRAALVLTADHELNASTFAVRIAASTGAGPHQAVLAGLAVLSGPRHGGATERAAALLGQWTAAEDPPRAAAEHVARGEATPGFGMPLYPGGDPRGRILIDRVAAACGGDARTRHALAAIRAAEHATGLAPTIDAGIGLLALVLALPPGSALGLFAVGRAVGWIGHYLEQRESGRSIRPRARYVGRHPR